MGLLATALQPFDAPTPSSTLLLSLTPTPTATFSAYESHSTTTNNVVDLLALAGRAETGLPTAIVKRTGLVLPWLNASGEHSGDGEEKFGDLATPGLPSEY